MGGEPTQHHPSLFRDEFAIFQLHHHVALQYDVIEQQVDVVVVTRNFQVILSANESKALAQFQQKLGDMLSKLALHIQLVVWRCHRHEVESVWIFECSSSKTKSTHGWPPLADASERRQYVA